MWITGALSLWLTLLSQPLVCTTSYKTNCDYHYCQILYAYLAFYLYSSSLMSGKRNRIGLLFFMSLNKVLLFNISFSPKIITILNVNMNWNYQLLTYLLPMHPFSDPWKHQKIVSWQLFYYGNFAFNELKSAFICFWFFFNCPFCLSEV